MGLTDKQRQEIKNMIDNDWTAGHIRKFLLDNAKNMVDNMFSKYEYARSLEKERWNAKSLYEKSKKTRDNQIIEDLEKLVNHMWQEEYDHWEEGANPEDHIFHAINNVKNYLEGVKNGRK